MENLNLDLKGEVSQCSVRNNAGSLHPLMLLFIFALSMGGLGVWGFLRHWRFLVENQLHLDKCVGRAAHELRDKLNSLGSDNRRIHYLRGAIVAAVLQTDLIPPLKAALSVVVAKQEATRFSWIAKQGYWMATQGCGKRGDSATPLPTLSLIRKPPDPVGPQPLTWTGKIPSSFHLQLNHPPRHAAARVTGKSETETGTSLSETEKEANFDQTEWTAIWTAPKRHSWTDFL